MVDGEMTLRTKGLGTGIMVSAMVARSLGFGVNITDTQLLDINAKRLGEKYQDEEAVTYIYESYLQKPLTEAPFVCSLNYGSDKDGCWMYRHRGTQIEDCVSCLKYLYPKLKYAFELDPEVTIQSIQMVFQLVQYIWGVNNGV